MEPSLRLFAVLSPVWASFAVDVAGVVAFGVSVAVLVATVTEKRPRTLSRVRSACVVSTGLLVATSVLGWPSRWVLALSCVGFLVSLQALALAIARVPPLGWYMERRATGADPGWWTEFETGFWRYARRGWRERNPLRRAVTRRPAPTSAREQSHASWERPS